MKYKIVVDSASDLRENYLNRSDIDFEVVPLTIQVDKKIYVDDKDIDIPDMLKNMHEYSGKSVSSCPSPWQYYKSFENSEKVFCVTITSKLSGSHNSAILASKMASNEGIDVAVIDSKGTCGVMELIVNKLVELIDQKLEYKEIVSEIEKYRDSLNLLFVLHRFDNLIKNGRMSKIAGIVANVFAINPICQASDGEIKIMEKVRGFKASLKRMVALIDEKIKETRDKILIISHCFATEEAESVKAMISEAYEFKEIRIRPMNGLASFYALEKGIIIGF